MKAVDYFISRMMDNKTKKIYDTDSYELENGITVSWDPFVNKWLDAEGKQYIALVKGESVSFKEIS